MRIGRSMKLVYELKITDLAYNPVPYKRTTQRAKFVSEDYERYREWKIFLGDKFCAQNERAAKEIYEVFNKKTKRREIHMRPRLSGAYFVETVATYKDKTHGDTDNVAKGVNDALFASDKYVSGSYDFKYGQSGGIIVKIYEIDGEFKES